MKQSLLHSGFSIFLLSISIVSCKKEAADNPVNPGTNITYVTSGFLCTMGIGENQKVDTLVLMPIKGYGTSTANVYSYGYIPKEDEFSITNNSNGTVSVKFKTPYVSGTKTYTHIGLYGSQFPLGTSTFYPFQLAEKESIETQFEMKRNTTDGRLFTLESKAVPGFYLSTIHPGYQYQPHSSVETKMAFSIKKQDFFFLPK
jgi:hypothetical protein